MDSTTNSDKTIVYRVPGCSVLFDRLISGDISIAQVLESITMPGFKGNPYTFEMISSILLGQRLSPRDPLYQFYSADGRTFTVANETKLADLMDLMFNPTACDDLVPSGDYRNDLRSSTSQLGPFIIRFKIPFPFRIPPGSSHLGWAASATLMSHFSLENTLEEQSLTCSSAGLPQIFETPKLMKIPSSFRYCDPQQPTPMLYALSFSGNRGRPTACGNCIALNAAVWCEVYDGTQRIHCQRGALNNTPVEKIIYVEHA